MNSVVVIDPGHGGSESGAVSPPPRVNREADLVLDIAWKLYGHLLDDGRIVPVMTRGGDYSPADYMRGKTDDMVRADMANRYRGDIFVSLHLNSVGAQLSDTSGYEAWHYPDSLGGRRLAESLMSAYEERFPDRRNRGCKPASAGEARKAANLTVLRETSMWAVIFEIEFINSLMNVQWVISNGEGIAIALARGIINYLSDFEWRK